ncbi:GNAT family N-acetyltransferase [Leifsonia sp. NPDC058292]|uniref:GNAT family N-acetyltransferase n=1 Tax=Leifsonia sp. NPDC058292 TaxID=3346428 RepID=UPI0036DB06CA
MNETAPSVALRPIERADLPFLQRLANDPQVRENVVGWDWPLSLAGQEAWFAASLANHDTRRFIVETADGRAIGLTGLWDIDWRSRTALTALKLGGDDEVRGRGYGTSAIRALMDFAFLDVGLNRLYSTIVAGNEASVAAYVRNSGWQEEGRLREHAWRGGRYVDLIQIGMLRSDYDALTREPRGGR